MLEPVISFLLAAAPPASSAAPPCVQELYPLLQRQEFDALRTASENCRQATDHPRTWYFAGLANLALGRPELAIISLRSYLQSDTVDEPIRLRENAQARLEQARAQTSNLELTIEPASSDLDTRVQVERADWEEPLTFFLSELERAGERASLALPPGSYVVSAARAGFLPVQRAAVVAAAGDTVPITLTLRSRPSPPKKTTQHEPPFPARRWAGAWGGAGGAFLIGGAPMLAVGVARSRYTPGTCSMSEQSIDGCRADLARATMLSAAGGGFLGSGLGLLVGGLTSLVPDARQRRKAWAVEAGLGGAVAATGVVLLGVAARSFNRINNDSDPAHPPWGYDLRISLLPSERGFFSGAVLLGAGVGLGISSLLGLVSPRFLGGQERTRAHWQPQPDGFTLKF